METTQSIPDTEAQSCCHNLQLCKPAFVAINTIECEPHYLARFEELFGSRAKAIDRIPGFLGMMVLKPQAEGDAYLVVSHWVDQAAFEGWTKSPEFMEGHKRAFEDMRLAKERGEEPPMKSTFRTYGVLTF